MTNDNNTNTQDKKLISDIFPNSSKYLLKNLFCISFHERVNIAYTQFIAHIASLFPIIMQRLFTDNSKIKCYKKLCVLQSTCVSSWIALYFYL